jgi:release factor glutamine methyltransferase
MNVASASRFAAESFSASSNPSVAASPALDASVILAHLLGMSRSALLAHPETELGEKERAFANAVAKRLDGLPVAYITGEKEFWGIPFIVTPDVLIPKSDTETLVERALALIDELAAECRAAACASGGISRPVRVLDVCTGSGCIAVSLKASRPGIEITATDISSAALSVARRNAQRSGTDIRFVEGDLEKGLPPFEPGDPFYDLVVSNPPYVPSTVAAALLEDGRNEPLLALDGGEDGLDLVRALVENVREVLVSGGYLLVETGEYNALPAAEFFGRRNLVGIVTHRDLEGQDRVVEGKKEGSHVSFD